MRTFHFALDTPTETPTDTLTPIPTPTLTETPTDISTSIPIPTDTPTLTSTPTATSTDSPTLTSTPTKTSTEIPIGHQKALVLIYAVLDNNLQSNWNMLVNNVERGVTENTDVRLFVDGPGKDDVYIYDVKYDNDDSCPTKNNPTCGYLLGNNPSKGDENSAYPLTLASFITKSVALYPEDGQLILALVGHGSGWSANALPGGGGEFIDPWLGQPRPWSGQPGGLLWDDHPSSTLSNTYSLSTRGLASALYMARQATNRKIDLLYMDGCSLGMVEIAYEVKDFAHYMIASPNTDWATFTYNRLIAMVKPNFYDIPRLGEIWLQTDVTYITGSSYNYPYTYALTDLTQMDGVATATKNFSDALIPLLDSDKTGVLEAFLRADRYDSDYNELIDEDDAYTDLNSFAYEIEQQFPEQPALQQAAANVLSAIATAVPSKESKSGVYWQSGDRWEWKNFGGLGIYLPLGWDEERRQYYNQDNIRWAYATTWDEFINKYYQVTWANVSELQLDRPPRPLETCAVTTDPSCAELAAPLVLLDSHVVYLPVIRK